MKHIYLIATVLISILLCPTISGQENNTQKTFDLSFVLGINMGATAPVPIPAEVRKINSYNPKFNPQLGINLVYNINNKWGVGAGATFDWKGMRVKDEVKYMYTSVTENNGASYLTGYFVGKNMTNIDMTHLTIPIYGTYRFNEKWQVKLGIYAARVLSNKFEGDVTDGYLRVGEPTGQKQEIEKATFDFSDDARDYDFGLLGGGEYRLTNRIGFYANMTWGLVPYFYTKSNPIQFRMTNIYGTVGITYRLK
ncbi:porin family protein [Dysgonomonas sp. BGC7]|uniref:porin family protein n=1 Tax=Dysgonomonas sp. BGC7 TaxID=1658008 RepID=UPI000A3FEE2E|nr:porin family protein [Dysgonomonas sp. BGC7]